MMKNVELGGVCFFSAPDKTTVVPFEIPAGVEYWEILTGGKVVEEGREYGRGTLFRHSAGDYTIHRSVPGQPYRCLAVRFLRERPEEQPVRIGRWADLNTFDDFCRETLRWAHFDRTDPTVFGPMLYHRLCWEFARGAWPEENQGLPLPLERARQLIQRDLAHPWTVEELAKRAAVSTSYLFALFERHLARSPHQYLLECRLHQARIALASGTRAIKEVARECGFANLESFYRAFRKHCGNAPGAYRRRYTPL